MWPCLFVFRSLIPLGRASQLEETPFTRDGEGEGKGSSPRISGPSSTSSLLHRRLNARVLCHLQAEPVVVVSAEKCSIRVELVEVEVLGASSKISPAIGEGRR